MEILEKVKEKWGAFGEWISIVAPIFGIFLYVHNENVHINNRIDTHIVEINKRCDLLHHEFIELLKENRSSNGR